MSEEPLTTKEKFLFGLSSFPDQFTYQIFQFLIFTFYFTVIRIPTALMLTAYILWGIWNAINDPVLGALSERTKLSLNLKSNIPAYVAIRLYADSKVCGRSKVRTSKL